MKSFSGKISFQIRIGGTGNGFFYLPTGVPSNILCGSVPLTNKKGLDVRSLIKLLLKYLSRNSETCLLYLNYSYT